LNKPDKSSGGCSKSLVPDSTQINDKYAVCS
jgi:hypothetical protein